MVHAGSTAFLLCGRNCRIFGIVETDDEALPPAAHTHDGFFKAVFSNPQHASAFFQSHLPPGIVAHTDWSTLALIPGSFVRSSLAQMHSDLLFSVRVGERETLLYLVFEHQSRPDPAMPLRLLSHVTEIFLKHHKEHGFPLPAVLPFVRNTTNDSSAIESDGIPPPLHSLDS